MGAATFLLTCLVCSSYGQENVLEKVYGVKQPSQSFGKSKSSQKSARHGQLDEFEALAILLGALQRPPAAGWSAPPAIGSPLRVPKDQTQVRMHTGDVFQKVQAERRSLLGKAIASLALSLPMNAAVAETSKGDGSIFVGTYLDPNHPGGTRTITILDGKTGLAQVEGGGGLREPAKYVLPAVVDGDRSISIDFSVSPKFGPKDFKGVYEVRKDGVPGIRFLADRNFWPRKNWKEELLRNFD